MSETLGAGLRQAEELVRAGRPGRAAGVLRGVVAEFPHEPEAWCQLAAAYLGDGKPKPALEAARRAGQLANSEAAHRLSSIALTELGRHEEAVAAARQAVALEPGDWRCQLTLAEALGDAGAMRDAQQPDGHEAVAAARRAVELAPGEPRCFEVLGDIALRAHRWDIAEQAYQAALRLDPANRHARDNLRLVREKAGTPPPRAPGGQPLPPVTEPPPSAVDSVLSLVWPAIRTLSLVLALGPLALVIGGLPSPGPLHGWLGVVLLTFTGLYVTRVIRRIPAAARPGLHRIVLRSPFLVVTVLPLTVGALCLLIWTVIAVFSPGDLQLLVLSCLASALGAVLARLRRRR
ncbi:tetratricopeptide (TPR) repeat protein [Crossiella equi]|uniref:Tetratricopeptide (TPR) repeat protein n=1 Tax=Crossiella equi TaxID=130796 RepID=A0ABS5ACJ1_9PSEU|nr:tetratricopeptide repeat protein [Crossiella equi]MBP2474304.1 tetratricopeptide (TPR) repeat protein [Crossiella equi]